MLRRVLGPLARRWGWVHVALSTQERFSEIHGGALAASVTLAAFLSLFPLLLVVVSVIGFFADRSVGLPHRVAADLGLTGESARVVTAAIAKARESRRVAGPVGLAGLLWSGLGLVAAMQFALDAVWQVSGRGLKDKAFGFVWLVGAGLVLGASMALTAAVNFLPGTFAAGGVVIGLGLDVALWLWTLKVLTNRDLGWAPLVPGAVLGGVGFEALKLVGSVYVPRAVAASSALYGSIGVVFATLAWLFFFGRLVVYTGALNVVCWLREHGTVTAEIEVPRMPGAVPVATTRAGEALPTETRAD